MRIKADGLAEAVQDELGQYASDVQEQVDTVVLRVARQCLSQIRRDSPRHSGDYRKGWTMQTKRGRLNVSAIIYNRTRYFLIHLLEFGHQKKQGGRVSGTPHIEPAEKQAEKALVDELSNVLGER